MRRSVALLTIMGTALVGTAPAVAAAQDASAPGVSVVVIEVASGRGDLASGGDALLRLIALDGVDAADLVVTDDGRDVSDAFVVQQDGTALGLVAGLDLGDNVIQAEAPDGRGARITLTNAPQSGPVFSGPLIEPWSCTNGSDEPDCSQEPTVTYHYRSTNPVASVVPPLTAAGQSVLSRFQPYDPADPPSDVATTTDDGEEVPFIVREEVGYSLRDQYRIAALWDPEQGDWPDPTSENPGYANKLVLTHGQSCDTSYESGTAPAVLFEDALSQGFAVASHALDHAGHNCNLVTQAESLIMTKEMVAERFGPIRYTIGSGCSGGSLVQQQVANAYPGVYQGITPQCSFTDAWSSAQQYVDYVGLRNFFEGPGSFESQILPAQWPSIFGHANPANHITFTEAIPNSGDPSRSCPGVPNEDVYSVNNPDGVRCSFQDYMRNVFGLDEDGKAYRPISNVGVQYGLSGLLASLTGDVTDPTRPPLTPAQFVALNAGVGGFDIDFEPTADRTLADPIAQDRVYRSGAVNTGAHLDEVAIIDLGGPEPGAFHDVYRKYSMRDRLIREHGTADNQVFWEGQTPLLGDASFVDDSIRAMDEWLAVVEADGRDVPLAQKIIDAKDEAGIAPRCVGAAGADVPLEVCRGTVDPTIFSSPRIEAGGGDSVVGFTDDTLDCQTMPLEDFDYAGQAYTEVFTEAEQATLEATFPDGVCDYSKPGVGFQAATAWLTYQNDDGEVIYGGTPMGPAPVSVPYGPSSGSDDQRPGPGDRRPVNPPVGGPPSDRPGANPRPAGVATQPASVQLPITGLPAPLAVFALASMGGALALRRR
ncbi:MAG: DUF6351 family protein [Nitriliruptor sp.]|uniref:DUF6351 family protein n=1 Tax=Nitriliruptor sp. TaxID=2448056 RepID=UPI00349FD936